MRQVPTPQPYLVIGNGRLARHLRHYFELEGIDCLHWHRAHTAPVERLVERAGVVLLLIADDAIEGFLARHQRAADPPWVHCSGSLTSDRAAGVHPLMSFGDRLYELSVYRRIPFVCERGGPSFGELFPGLVNPHAAVARDLKPLYHALCVLGGNFTTLLWQKVFSVSGERLGLDRSLFVPYLEQVTDNLIHHHDSLTGPLTRGDRATIGRHLEALRGDPFEGVYRSFVAAYAGQTTAGTP